MATMLTPRKSFPRLSFPLCPNYRPVVSLSYVHRSRSSFRHATFTIGTCKAMKGDSVSRFADNQPRTGADVLVEALERQGVTHVFAYPGSASTEIHQALTRSSIIRHGQGGVFAAEGYARSSGFPGVCIATSDLAAYSLVPGLADARMDSIPLVAITGNAPGTRIDTIVEVSRPLTKSTYVVLDVEDIPRVVKEAFYLAQSGRPSPVLIDIPKGIQPQLVVPDWNQTMQLRDDKLLLPKALNDANLEHIIRLVSESKKPALYVGGGCLNSSEELRRFVALTGIPVASTLMGPGIFSLANELSLDMVGMHGADYANYAVDKSDLLLALGVRFHEHVTGKVEKFASQARIVHIDIDSTEFGKNKQPHWPLCGDVKLALEGMNKLLEGKGGKLKLDFSAWREELKEQKLNYPLTYKGFGDIIPPPYAIQVLDELTNGNAIITTSVGQHQVWAAQFYKFKKPRQLLTSGGLGEKGFGLPAAMGAIVANPDAIVVNIESEGSFIWNLRELATVRVENLPIKMMILNNPYPNTVVQGEDQFHKALGDSSRKSGPNMLQFAEACKIPAARVEKMEDLRAAIQNMLDTPGPFLLDVTISIENMLFM